MRGLRARYHLLVGLALRCLAWGTCWQRRGRGVQPGGQTDAVCGVAPGEVRGRWGTLGFCPSALL